MQLSRAIAGFEWSWTKRLAFRTTPEESKRAGVGWYFSQWTPFTVFLHFILFTVFLQVSIHCILTVCYDQVPRGAGWSFSKIIRLAARRTSSRRNCEGFWVSPMIHGKPACHVLGCFKKCFTPFPTKIRWECHSWSNENSSQLWQDLWVGLSSYRTASRRAVRAGSSFSELAWRKIEDLELSCGSSMSNWKGKGKAPAQNNMIWYIGAKVWEHFRWHESRFLSQCGMSRDLLS